MTSGVENPNEQKPNREMDMMVTPFLQQVPSPVLGGDFYNVLRKQITLISHSMFGAQAKGDAAQRIL